MIRRQEEMEQEVRQRMREGKGEARITHVFKKEEMNGSARLCAVLELEPGSSVGWHEHGQEEEIYYLMEGRAQVNDNGQLEELKAGDAVLTGNGGCHSIESVGSETLRLLAVILLYSQ